MEDLVGRKFGKLTILNKVDNPGNNTIRGSFWNCLCECGNSIIVPRVYLTHQGKEDCGCVGKEKQNKLVQEIIGKRVGSFTIVSFSHQKDGRFFYNCTCDCGEERVVKRDYLIGKNNNPKCSCNRKKKHDQHGSRFYKIWQNMKTRCNNKNVWAYQYYGEKGIQICDAWNDDFRNFYSDMFESYVKNCEEFGVDNTTLDRINNLGDYNKENCKWATRLEQTRNSSMIRNINVIHEDGTKEFFETISDAAKKYNLFPNGISLCLHGKRKSHGGFKYEFVEEST